MKSSYSMVEAARTAEQMGEAPYNNLQMVEKNMKNPDQKNKSRISILISVILVILLASALIVVLALAITIGVDRANNNRSSTDTVSMEDSDDKSSTVTDPVQDSPGICLTTECVELSSQISQSLDMSVDPCENFYLFSCNGFNTEAIIPHGGDSTSTLGSTAELNVERIRVLMESQNDRNLDSFRKAQVFYRTCLDTDAIDQQAVDSLHEVLLTLGGWPLVGMDLNDSWSINNEAGFLTEILYDSSAFFSWTVLPNVEDSSTNIFYIKQGGLTFTGINFTVPQSRNMFVNFMVEVFRNINSSMPISSYMQAAQEIVDFEVALAEFVDLNFVNISFLEGSFNITSYNFVMDIFPEFDWMKNMQFFGKLGGFTITPSDKVGLRAPISFLQGLNDLMRRTDSRVLQNYAKWHFIYNILQDLSEPFRDKYYGLQQAFARLSSVSPRYRVCVEEVENDLKYAIARGFTEDYVDSNLMSNVSELINEVRNAMQQRIMGRDWLDSSTRERALNKLKLIQSFVGYPVEIMNNTFLESIYSDYNISQANGHFMNKLNTRRSNSIFELSFISTSNSRDTWNLLNSPPTILNAAYYPFYNQIYIFEGLLDRPIFAPYWPNYFKYGTLGTVIGHEITHGFDNSGRQYDEFGRLENWWSDISLREFNNRAECLVDQYSNYSVEAGPVNGRLTLGENIADNGGLATAYAAYKNVMKNTGPEKTLPGLPYSPEQLFFIGAAQEWCLVSTMAREAILLITDVHSPSHIRPIGMMSNSREFAEAFKCPKGSPMNPEKKCELW